jgi:glycosyltransferase involved in cell wall biosynthesis
MIVHAAYPQDVRVMREARVAVAAGYEVDVVALRETGEPRNEVVDGVHVFRLPISHHRGIGALGVLREYLGFVMLASVVAGALAARRRYAVVQVHNPPDFLMLTALVPRLLGARVVFDIHDLSPDMFAMRFQGRPGSGPADTALRLIERWATKLADVVITVHEPYRRELAARGVPADKVIVVMNSLDEHLLGPARDLPPSPGFRIVYHGTITPSYGVQLVVEAAARLSDAIPDLRLELYGEGDSLPDIQSAADELGITDRLTVSGRYLPQAEVLERVAGASIGVIPNLATRLNQFALSSKLFEYVALEIPVVSADLPTIREHFDEDEVLFFRAGDAASLADAISAVAADPSAALARADRALARYRRDYRWHANAARYAAVLDSLRLPTREQPLPPQPVRRPPAVPAQSPETTLASFEVSEPLLFFDQFRVPSRTRPLETIAEGGAPERHPLRQLSQLRWSEHGRVPDARRVYWPSARTGFAAGEVLLPLDEYRLGSTPIYCRLLPDSVTDGWFDRSWRREAAVTTPDGAPAASVRRDAAGSVFLPFDPSELILNYWSESYRQVESLRLSRAAWEVGRRSYYRVRPIVPRQSQIMFRRLLRHLQTRATFPRWPSETALDDVYAFLFRYVVGFAPTAVPWISPWPSGFDWALVLTHDVETEIGYGNVRPVAELEESLGYRSSFNFVPKRYRVDDEFVSSLLHDGFEIGVHGLHHDGRDFGSLATLTQRMPEMRRYGDRWHASGFRSPATHRNWAWMPAIDFDYDSSYPDTDPLEPYPGGCCSTLPFFNGHLVELPITLAQDHTLFRILDHTDEAAWVEKIAHLQTVEGMALLLTHPDYLVDERLLAAYAGLLRRYRDDPTVWQALPNEVNLWWRRRAASSVSLTDDGWRVSGPAASDASLTYGRAHRSDDDLEAAPRPAPTAG